MRKITLILLAFVGFSLTSFAQEYPTDKNYFQISPRIGYDVLPMYKNNTPYIDYKGGIDLGISLDYYWGWFGVGADFDYIKNKPKSTYPTSNMSDSAGVLLGGFNLSENGITRMFYGIGPNAQIRTASGKFKVEFNTRLGLGSVKGGRTLLTSSTSTNRTLNFHAGYDASNVFSFKGQVRTTYFFSKNFGVNLGVYYINHFKVPELTDLGIASAYADFDSQNGKAVIKGMQLREESGRHSISSIGVFAGVTIKFGKSNKSCAACGCNITITAKDKFTGKVLPNTDVVLTDMEENIIESGTTNSYGVVVFKGVKEDDYTIKGRLYNVALQNDTIKKSDFKNCEKDPSGIQKELLYADKKFILKGRVVECNSTEGIDNVTVVLKDKVNANQKNTLSDNNGGFIFHVNQSSTYALHGNKDGYFSNEVTLSTNSYNRNSTLFINFEMCVDPCGKAIRLDNINFDLDKWDILPDAIPDLQKVVRLMKNHPKIIVEMSSHTDSRGSNTYNQTLSQKRAQSTVDYLVKQGVSRSRLIARGAGETELLNRCADNVQCSEEEHRINRRTEFKVVCPQ